MRVWRKGNPWTLLVGSKWLRLLSNTIRRVLRKLKTELPCDPAISLLGAYPKEMKTLTQRRTNKQTPPWPQRHCLQQPRPGSKLKIYSLMDEWIKKAWCVHTHSEEHYSVLKEGGLAICDNVNEPWGHYAKWNKLNRERQFHLYVDLKNKKPNPQIQRTEGWLPEVGRGRGGGQNG